MQKYSKQWKNSIYVTILGIPYFIKMNAQIVDPHAWRQSQTAWTVEGWLQNGFNPFQMYLPIKGSLNIWNMEFPIVQYLAYFFSKALRVTAEYSLGLVGFISLLAICFALQRILTTYLSKKNTLISVIGYCLMPYVIWWWSTGLIDLTSTALAFCGFAFHVTRRDRDSKALYSFGISILFFFSFLIKPSIGFVYLVWLILDSLILKNEYKKSYFVRFLGTKSAITGSAFGCLAYLAWTRSFSAGLPPDDPRWGWLLTSENRGFYFGEFEQYINPFKYLIEIGHRFIPTSIGIFGSCLILISIFRKPAKIQVTGLISIFSSLFIFINLNYVHDYYQISIVPIAYVILCVAIENLTREFYPKRHLYVAILIFTLATTIFSTTSKAYLQSFWNPPWVPSIITEINATIPANESLAFLGYGETPYYSYLRKSNTYMAIDFQEFQNALEKGYMKGYRYFVISADFQENVMKYFDNARYNYTRVSQNIFEIELKVEK